jgi:hypothetical protein
VHDNIIAAGGEIDILDPAPSHGSGTGLSCDLPPG